MSLSELTEWREVERVGEDARSDRHGRRLNVKSMGTNGMNCEAGEDQPLGFLRSVSEEMLRQRECRMPERGIIA
jgi:hypothetical protein